MDKELISRLKSLTVLYAEDEENIRKNIADTLRYYVKEIIEAKNGKEAYELYCAHKPDLLMTDILMPQMNGIELVEKIRKDDKKTPIIMITAHTEKQFLLSAVKLHLEHYLVKPVSLPDILEVLANSLEQIALNKSLAFNLPKDFQYDLDKKVLLFKGEIIKLTRREISFFEYLLQNMHRVVSYEELQTSVWGDDVMTDNAVRSVVLSLRKKLPQGLITNLSGVGYKLVFD
jgi:DNA-binding response OmpR family regulator